MPLLMRGSDGRLYPVNPGLARHKGNQGGMGRIITEADIMSRLPDADIVGAIGPGVVPGGEQAVGARRAELAGENASPPAPTYRPLAGAQQNNRGNAAFVTLATLLGGPAQAIASIVETSKNTGDDAEIITLQLALELPPNFNDVTVLGEVPTGYAQANLDVVALIEWGVGGAFFQAEVDWNQGVSIPICASFLRVKALVGAINILHLPDIIIVLKASLGYGNSNALSTSSAARRTVPLTTDGADLGAVATGPAVPIPPWAMGFTVFDAGANPGGALDPDYTITLSDGINTTAVFKMVSRSNIGRQMEGQFPVPARSRFLTLTNNLGVAMSAPKAMFNLGF